MPYIFDGIFSVDTADIATNTGLKTKGIASIDTSLTGGISYNGIYSSRLNRILTVKVTPNTATVVVTDSDNQEISANSDGTYTLLLGQTYEVSASETYYATQTKEITVLDNMELNITLSDLRRTLTITTTPDTATVVVTDSDSQTIEANLDGTYTVIMGETYTITVSAEGYITDTSTYTVDGDHTETVTLVEE